MTNLISIEQTVIGVDLIDTVNARELHEFLEVRSEFRHWIKNRIDDFGFVEGRDFITVGKNLPSGGRKTDYYITIDMAKELSMVERNEKGKQARQYFIECERKVKGQTSNLPIDKAASHFLAFKTIATAFGLKDNAQLVSANVATRKLTGFDFQALLEIELDTPDQVHYLTPTELGQTLNPPLSGQRINNLLEERGLQTKVGKTWVATDAGEKHTRLIDTGKTHSNGTMIQQMKWASATLQNI